MNMTKRKGEISLFMKYVFKKYTILCMIFLYPFFNLYSIYLSNLTSLSSTYLLIFLFLPIIIFSFNKRTIYFIIKNIPYYFLVIIILLIGLLWSTELTRGIFYIISLFLAALFSCLLYNLGLLKSAWRAFAFSVTIFSILLYFKILQRNFVYYEHDRFGYIQGNEIFLDPNWLANWLAISFLYYFFSLMKEKKMYTNSISKVKKILYFLLSILNLYFILLTASRSVFLALSVAIYIYLLISKKIKQFSLINLLLAFVILINVNVNVFDNLKIFDRLEETSILKSDRMDLAISSFKALVQDPFTFLMGYGTGGGDKAIGPYYYGAIRHEDGVLRYNNHNVYLDLLLQIGSLGILIIFSLVFFILKNIFISIKKENYAFITLLIFTLITSSAYNPIKNGIWVITGGFLIVLYLFNYSSDEENTKLSKSSISITKLPTTFGRI